MRFWMLSVLIKNMSYKYRLQGIFIDSELTVKVPKLTHENVQIFRDAAIANSYDQLNMKVKSKQKNRIAPRYFSQHLT